MKRAINSLIVFSLFLIIATHAAFAISVPSFPSCLNPQGSLKANYSDGTHGIVGRTATYTGADKVYQVDANTLVQCFCPNDGRGIQTNWLKVSGFSQNDINILKNDGWYFIADGSAWGLDSAPYVAKNADYSCNAGIGGAAAGIGGGENIAGKVLGLASTGSSDHIYKLWLSGLVALALGVWLKKHDLFKKA